MDDDVGVARALGPPACVSICAALHMEIYGETRERRSAQLSVRL